MTFHYVLQNIPNNRFLTVNDLLGRFHRLHDTAFDQFTANEKLSIYDDATSKACIELLPVADSVTLALANLKDADPDIIKGIELISNQLAKSFEKLKIESYGKAGDAFDPNLHNAVSKIEDENLGADTIAAVYQTGYKIGDKIIRHAMVQVANCD